jgi:glycosyltransferase involved in cell wall biosynthesis
MTLKQLNVLLVHLSDGHKGGGGGIAMFRLHQGLRKAGIGTFIMCREKTEDLPYIDEIPRRPKIENLLLKGTKKLGLNDIHLIGSFQVKKMDGFINADVIDFQGIHTRTLSYLALPSLTKHKPAVFTMHDMWAFTGHCAYSYDCSRWKIGCGDCPYPNTHPAIKRDNTRLEWKLKNWAYKRSNLVFVAPSKWLVDLAKSSMLCQFPVHYISNGVDTDIFYPHDRENCRAKLSISQKKHVLMFASLNLTNRRKGGELLLKALKRLPGSLKLDTVLLTIGKGGEQIGEMVGIQTINLGYIHDDRLKATAYSASDLFIFPTRADNQPLVLLESLACGTPAVSFRIGGVPEIIQNGQTGYLAEIDNIDEFCEAIVGLLEDDVQRQKMGEICRKKALQEYRQEIHVKRYIELYRSLV